MKKFTIIAFLLIVASAGKAQNLVNGVVVEILEGDIFKVLSDKGDSLYVKLRNVECPEIAQDCGDKAINYARKVCLNKNISINYEEFDRDRNILGTVVLENGKDVGAELLNQGLAWHYMKGLAYGPDSETYMELEQAARERKKGLWKEAEPIAPWTFRSHKNKWDGKTSM